MLVVLWDALDAVLESDQKKGRHCDEMGASTPSTSPSMELQARQLDPRVSASGR